MVTLQNPSGVDQAWAAQLMKLLIINPAEHVWFRGLSFFSLPEPIAALFQALESWDLYSAQHSVRVTQISLRFAHYLGLPLEVVRILGTAGYLHDIGKLAIDHAILRKTGPLTPKEWALVKNHPVIGQRMVEPLGLGGEAEILILHHHERWNGQGYPHGLKQEEIPLSCQILALADCYDALTHDRPYRCARSRSEALVEIQAVAGAQFRRALAWEFIDMIASQDQVKIAGKRQEESLREGHGSPFEVKLSRVFK